MLTRSLESIINPSRYTGIHIYIYILSSSFQINERMWPQKCYELRAGWILLYTKIFSTSEVFANK